MNLILKNKDRKHQLPPQTYSKQVSTLFDKLYKCTDFPSKLRLLGILERIWGNKRIITKTQYGFIFAVDKADLIQNKVFYQGCYEQELSNFFFKSISPEDIFYDIGANVGYYSCLAAQTGCRKVIAFEPDPLNMDILKLNIALNQYYNKQLVFMNMGIGDTLEARTFYRSHVANTGVSGFYEPDNPIDSFTVDLKSIDHLVFEEKLEPPHLIKIDVEGYEEKALLGAENTIFQFKPKYIVFEAECDEQANISNPFFYQFFKKQQYQIQHIQRPILESRENYVAYYDQRIDHLL